MTGKIGHQTNKRIKDTRPIVCPITRFKSNTKVKKSDPQSVLYKDKEQNVYNQRYGENIDGRFLYKFI